MANGYTVENDAVEIARVNMEKAMEELKAADDSTMKAAIARYREASGAYRTMIRRRYNF